MNSDMIWPRKEIEDLSLSITKTGESLSDFTHAKPQETLEIKLTQPR